MNWRILILLLLTLLPSWADTLLVVTEPYARFQLGPLLQEWAAQIEKEGRYTRVIIREAPRYTLLPGTSAQRWAAIGAVSNLIAWSDPDAAVFVGEVAGYLGGGLNMDGHNTRCWLSDGPYMLRRFIFTDTTDWSGVMSPVNYLATNVPGDGRFDENTAALTNFARPVSRISAFCISNSASSTFSSGCLSNLLTTPVVSEGLALRAYFTNNLAFRRGQWSVSASNFITGPLWGSTDVATITNYVRGVSTAVSLSAIGGGSRPRFIYHNWANEEMNNVYDGSCQPIRALFAVCFRSYGFELHDIEGYGNTMTRWLFPGRTTEPYALVTGWSRGASFSGDSPFWLPNQTNTHVADIVRSSANSYASAGGTFAGSWPLFYWLAGDLSLPLTGATTNLNKSTLQTLILP